MTTTTVRPDRRQDLALLVISAATLLVVLDSTIVNVALPSIQADLKFSAATLEWVVTAYSVAFGGLLLFGGRASDLYGRRRMFLVGIALFTGASLLGGLALTQFWLIAARALQGVGAAIAAPAALSLVATTFPEGGPRNRAMGWYATVAGSAGAIGLVLGGLLTHIASWRWVFFVAIPIGVLVLIAAPRVLPESPRRQTRVDLLGALTGTAGVALLVYGLIESSWPWLAVGLAFLLVFVLVESRVSAPLLPLRLFADRRRSAAYAVTLTVGVGLYGITFFLMLYVQQKLGFGAVLAGLGFLPLAIGIGVLAAAMGRLAGRIGVRVGVVGGPLVAALGAVWLYFRISGQTGYGGLVGPLALLGAGLGAAVVPLTLTVLAGVRDGDAGIASALVSAGQQIGGAVGLAALGAVGTPAAYLVAAAVLVFAAALAF